MLDDDVYALAERIISKGYVSQAKDSQRARNNLFKTLLSTRRLPRQGWDDNCIETFIKECAEMDSNNFLANVGVGEREARVASALVRRRHYGLAHGMGRSGDLTAEQPKAAGSSLLVKVTNFLVADALVRAGLTNLGACTVLPLATGMALTMALLALRDLRPPTARYVVWSRIDQQTCAKSVLAAKLELVPVELRAVGDQLETDLDEIIATVERLGPENVVAVVTTTSCFAPRASDDVLGVAQFCAQAGVGHVINNAYGVQTPSLCNEISKAWRRGRVDAVVQSTDKNFMVPVGGAIVACGDRQTAVVEGINKAYPGRASISPLVDVLITLLHWGEEGWDRVRREREDVFPHLRDRLAACAERNGERVLSTPGNPISLAMTLDTIQPAPGDARQVTLFGSMLFNRCVSGTRVVPRGAKAKEIGPHVFHNYGAHCNAPAHAYLTAAVALGTTVADVDLFIKRLDATMHEYRKKFTKRAARSEAKRRERAEAERDVIVEETPRVEEAAAEEDAYEEAQEMNLALEGLDPAPPSPAASEGPAAVGSGSAAPAEAPGPSIFPEEMVEKARQAAERAESRPMTPSPPPSPAPQPAARVPHSPPLAYSPTPRAVQPLPLPLPAPSLDVLQRSGTESSGLTSSRYGSTQDSASAHSSARGSEGEAVVHARQMTLSGVHGHSPPFGYAAPSGTSFSLSRSQRRQDREGREHRKSSSREPPPRQPRHSGQGGPGPSRQQQTADYGPASSPHFHPHPHAHPHSGHPTSQTYPPQSPGHGHVEPRRPSGSGPALMQGPPPGWVPVGPPPSGAVPHGPHGQGQPPMWRMAAPSGYVGSGPAPNVVLVPGPVPPRGGAAPGMAYPAPPPGHVPYALGVVPVHSLPPQHAHVMQGPGQGPGQGGAPYAAPYALQGQRGGGRGHAPREYHEQGGPPGGPGEAQEDDEERRSRLRKYRTMST